ncbi:MAG: hypothetical protein ACFCU6_01320 [Balneolaceae bacterium]
MTRFYNLFYYLFLVVVTFGFLYSCSDNPETDWKKALPNSTTLIIIPEENNTIEDILNKPYLPLLDDISPAAIQLTGQIDPRLTSESLVKAILLYPDTSDDLKPVWIVTLPQNGNLYADLKKMHQKPFVQNRYEFGGFEIDKLFISSNIIYTVKLQDVLLFSESSIGLENSIRALNDDRKRIQFPGHNFTPGTFIVNMPMMHQWVEQIAKVEYRPVLIDMFAGTTSTELYLASDGEEEWSWQLLGEIKIENDEKPLVRAISGIAREPVLDRYVPANASAFSIFRLTPRMTPYPAGQNIGGPSKLDQYLTANENVWRNLAGSIGDETAFAAFAESGALSTSEFLFLRQITDRNRLESTLD